MACRNRGGGLTWVVWPAGRKGRGPPKAPPAPPSASYRLVEQLGELGQDEVLQHCHQQPAEVQEGECSAGGDARGHGQAPGGSWRRRGRRRPAMAPPCARSRLPPPPAPAGALHGAFQPAAEADERAPGHGAAQQIRSERCGRHRWPPGPVLPARRARHEHRRAAHPAPGSMHASIAAAAHRAAHARRRCAPSPSARTTR